MSKTITIDCLSTVLSPLTHMARTEGNEAVIAREAVVTPQGIRWVPVVTGNALRHRMVREPAARFLLDRWGCVGTMSMPMLNLLFHGGNLTGSTNRVDTDGTANVFRWLPILKLLGGALPDAILPSSLRMGRGVLACRENASRLQAMFGDDVPAGLRTAESFCDSYQYTRGDARKTVLDAPEAGKLDDSNLMIFSGQCVVSGSILCHRIVVEHANDLELGCLLLAISHWRSAGGTVGGQASRGHGVLDTLLRHDLDYDGLIAAYIAHVDAMKDEAIAWLDRTYRGEPKPAKPAKGKKGGKPDDAPILSA